MTELLREAWNEVADGYDRYFAPRFGPWQADALAALPETLPGGALVVTCCGTGQELVALAGRFPDRAILGSDLSDRMVELAAARCAAFPRVRVERADALEVPSGSAAVMSCFGLQQMPAPLTAIERWTGALAPGGVASVMFWPRVADDDGPFARLRALAAERIPEPPRVWEGELVDAARAAGGEVLRYERVTHCMMHPSARMFFDAMVGSGPWRALARRVGSAVLDEIGAAFVAAYGDGELEHRAHARHLVVRR